MPSIASWLRLVAYGLERSGLGLRFRFQRCLLFAGVALARQLRHAVRQVIHDIEAGDVLQIQEVHGLRLLLAEDRDEYVTARHFLLAARLHVKHGTLQHALEPQRGLHVRIVVMRQQGRLLLDEFGQLAPQFRDIRIAGLENLVNLGNVQERKQQVLDRHELMTLIARLLERLVKTKL